MTPIPLATRQYIQHVRANQMLWSGPVSWVFRTLIPGRVQIDLTLADLKPGYRYVFAANHQSAADPFIITTLLPATIRRSLGTFRFMAHAGLFRNPLARWGLHHFGGFPAKPYANLPYGVEAARAYLGRGQVVVIFPEGQRALPGKVAPKRGVARIASDPRVRIIPVHLQWTNGLPRRYQLTIGKPLPGRRSQAAIMDAIYTLPLP